MPDTAQNEVTGQDMATKKVETAMTQIDDTLDGEAKTTKTVTTEEKPAE